MVTVIFVSAPGAGSVASVKQLQEEGFQVDCCPAGPALTTVLAGREPSVVLIDLSLPDTILQRALDDLLIHSTVAERHLLIGWCGTPPRCSPLVHARWHSLCMGCLRAPTSRAITRFALALRPS
jgi:hypothetical protein